MAQRFSLKDHLFNADSVGQLAQEYHAAIPDFDGRRFLSDCLSGFPERELLARMDWMADCLERQLTKDFPRMADQLEVAMPAPLDPALKDDDFGRFIHGLPGILAVRHGLEDHRERALDLLHAATQRFSMEFYIRPFLNRWPEQTLARLALWAKDENYHVRRLVSEGTRPKLPWAKKVTLNNDQTAHLLTQLHGDGTRYVTRSVANHLNDIAKTEPALVMDLLANWCDAGRQNEKELAWMTRHALRTLVKQGHRGALLMLGYRGDVAMQAEISLGKSRHAIGDILEFSVSLKASEDLPVLVDYRVQFARPDGKSAEKVFKLKSAQISAGKVLILNKKYHLKGDATTFTLHPGPHRITLQVNGADLAWADFDLQR